ECLRRLRVKSSELGPWHMTRLEEELVQITNLFHFVPADIDQRLATLGSRLAAATVIFVAFVAASFITKRIICTLDHQGNPLRHDVLTLIGQVAKGVLLIFGAITALGTLGVNVSALVAGLGLTGFALGFAFRDALSNVLAGVMILIYRPFHHGDQVLVAGFE